MAQACYHGAWECDGCGACFGEPAVVGTCEHCVGEIQEGDDYYRLPDDTLLHDDCLIDWAAKYRVRGD